MTKQGYKSSSISISKLHGWINNTDYFSTSLSKSMCYFLTLTNECLSDSINNIMLMLD